MRNMKKKKRPSGSAMRRKGHDLERYVAKRLREIYPYTSTARKESKILDDCKVDVVNLPFLIQCKSGYESPRPKYEQILHEIKNQIQEKIYEPEKYLSLPSVVVHKLNRKPKEEALTIMFFNDFVDLVEKQEKYNNLEKIFQKILHNNPEIMERRIDNNLTEDYLLLLLNTYLND